MKLQLFQEDLEIISDQGSAVMYSDSIRIHITSRSRRAGSLDTIITTTTTIVSTIVSAVVHHVLVEEDVALVVSLC